MGQYLKGGRDEKWGFYNTYDFQLPSEHELQSLRALIIPGSNVRITELSDLPWLQALIAFLQKVRKTHPDIKILGISLGS